MTGPESADDPPPRGASALSDEGIAHVAHCLRTLRSIRRLRPDPVDPALIDFVVDLAVRAGSGSNRQPWRFVIVRDPSIRSRLGAWYLRGWHRLEAAGRTSRAHPAASLTQRRITASARQLAENFAAAPIVIVVCYLPSLRNPAGMFAGASVYPAVQNLLVAARAVGLGATLTTMQALGGASESSGEPDLCAELRDILGIPDGPVPAAVIPIGWPDEPFGETTRKPASEVSYLDRWGQALT
jgi:nitroreductase